MSDYFAERKSRAAHLLLVTSAVAFLNYLRFILDFTFPDSVVENVIWIGDITWRNRWFADFLVPLSIMYWLGVGALAASLAQQVAAGLWTGRTLEGYYSFFLAVAGGTLIAGFTGPYNLGFISIQDAKVSGLPTPLLMAMISFLVFLSSFCAIQMLLDPKMTIDAYRAGKL